MEVSIVNGDLALVNVVPLEKYLYSVVGAEVYSSWPAEALKVQAVAKTFLCASAGGTIQDCQCGRYNTESGLQRNEFGE